jgi:hypothetical protein
LWRSPSWARAANLGGDIRHPEIRAAGAAAPAEGDPERFITSAIKEVAVYSTWAWPAAEAVHFLGLCLSFGVLLAVNLRILGVKRQTPFAEVHRLLPWGMLGFGANLITGMFFFVGQPGQYIASAPFFWKTIFLVIAGANFLYLTVFGKAWRPRRTAMPVSMRALPTRRWRSHPLPFGSPCCMRAECFRSSENRSRVS